MTEPRKIGFRTSRDIELEPMQQINTIEGTEEEQENPIVMLEDYIPGAVYDAQGNVITAKSFNAQIKKTKAEARNLTWSALAKLILAGSIGFSILLVAHRMTKNPSIMTNKVKSEYFNKGR